MFRYAEGTTFILRLRGGAQLFSIWGSHEFPHQVRAASSCVGAAVSSGYDGCRCCAWCFPAPTYKPQRHWGMHGIQKQVRAALDAARSRKDDSAVTRLEYEELKAVAAAVKALAKLNHEDFLPP